MATPNAQKNQNFPAKVRTKRRCNTQRDEREQKALASLNRPPALQGAPPHAGIPVDDAPSRFGQTSERQITKTKVSCRVVLCCIFRSVSEVRGWTMAFTFARRRKAYVCGCAGEMAWSGWEPMAWRGCLFEVGGSG
jgi:hypothetical protein